MISKAKASIVILLLLTQLFLVSVMIAPNQVLAQTQTPTLTIVPASSSVTSSTFTVYVAVSPLQNLNSIHFVLSFNDGPLFLDVTSTNIVAGNLFTGTQPTMTVGNYYLNSTGLSYLNVLFELQDTQTVASTGTKNVAAITFNLLSNSMPGMQSGLNLVSADALFFNGTNYDYVDNLTGLTMQGGSVIVGYNSTSISLNPVQATVGNPTVILSTISGSAGNPLAGLSVDYYVGSQKVGTAVTNASGISSVLYTPPAVGTFTIGAQFVGNQPGGKYASSNSSSTLTVTQTVQPTPTPTVQPTPTSTPTPTATPVQQTATTISLSSQKTNITISQDVILTATLKDANAAAVSGAEVDFSAYMGGQWTKIGTVTTGSDGTALLDYTPPITGSIPVKAQFAGDTHHLGSSSDQIVLVVNLIATTLELNAPTEAKVGQEIMLSSVLKDANQNAIVGATITYSEVSNGVEQQIGTSKTDINGIASIPFTPTANASYLITAEFSQNTNYLASSNSQTVSVGLIATIIAINAPANGKVGDAISIDATLTDSNQQPIAQANVQFQVLENGVWVPVNSAVTNSLGVASITYNPDKVGPLSIKAVFTGNTDNAGSVSSVTILEVTETNLVLNMLPYIVIAVLAVAIVAAVAIVLRRRRKQV